MKEIEHVRRKAEDKELETGETVPSCLSVIRQSCGEHVKKVGGHGVKGQGSDPRGFLNMMGKLAQSKKLRATAEIKTTSAEEEEAEPTRGKPTWLESRL